MEFLISIVEDTSCLMTPLDASCPDRRGRLSSVEDLIVFSLFKIGYLLSEFLFCSDDRGARKIFGC